MNKYQDKNVVIIGLGVTGLSCVDYFIAQNVIPKVIDTRKEPQGLAQLDPRVACHLGSFNLDWILAADLIVVSPGIALATPELQQAQSKGVEIIGDIELFCREVNLLENKKIVAITGANGKTTVTSLVSSIIATAGIKVAVGGNIGKPALSLLNEDHDVYVLELSSFQLETTKSLRATAATILNISEDHMDRYPLGITQYTAAKQRIYHNAKNCIVNHDDRLTFPEVRSDNSNCIEFGLHNGKYHLDETFQHLMINDDIVLDTAKMKLIGIHNYLNALAALAIADCLGIDQAISCKAICEFNGLPHRFELISKRHDVMWINDSKATNVGSTIAALNSIVCKGTLFLLLGGDGKAADFTPLIPCLNQASIRIYCYGRDKLLLAQLKPEATTVVDTLQDAMIIIRKQIKPDDVVLLSPACASLDQFKNYIERGNAFTKLVEELD